MLLIEAALIICIMILGIKASISDCRESVIPNELLIKMLPVILLLDLLYYGLFASVYLENALINLAFVSIFSFFLYSFNLWAAGDSKLVFLITLAIPARLYSYWITGPFPGFILLVIIFSLAFIYVIADSIRLGIKNGDLLKINVSMFSLKSLIRSYFFMVGTMTVCNLLIIPIVRNVFSNVGLLITAVDFMIIFALRQVREKADEKIINIYTIGIWVLLIILQIMRIIPRMRFGIDVKAWLIVLIVMTLRLLAEKYNYQQIKVDDLKPRMIPSAYTVISFRTSKVKGLPEGITEDLRSRLKEPEIDAIRRWSQTKQGKDTIIIVRKIPFAIFIFVGSLVFLLFEVVLLWRTY